jgi:hypothetical protein
VSNHDPYSDSVDGKLRKIPAAGGQSETICEVWTVCGGAWSRSGEIVYSSGVKGLYRVPASGGLPVQNPSAEERPWLLSVPELSARRPAFLGHFWQRPRRDLCGFRRHRAIAAGIAFRIRRGQICRTGLCAIPSRR